MRALLICALLWALPAAAELPVLRIAVLKVGTVNWELDSIAHHGDDTANGFRLEVRGTAGSAASMVAFQGGAVDAVVSDWIWVARQRAAGRDYVFIPYSRAVGAILVPADSPAQSLADLDGARIGIAGGALDKSWLILRAYAQRRHGIDLARRTTQVFAAPPLVFKAALDGEFGAAVNYWHFNAKMEAAGMRKLVDVGEAAAALGLDPATPLLGYVLRGEMLRERPALAHGLMRASRAAKDRLARDDAEWDRLRPLMRAGDDATYRFLRDGFRAGIPEHGPVDEAAADRMFRLMAELGGAALTGSATRLPDGVFAAPPPPKDP
ncbi:ABC transporter substrate-binding protein [Sulfitobacter albidus]|uniref:ABC transporter substrate-binding protein n=1 Tax=Sulfitobacter albidus TaxID=2829501 RepID=A0A975PMZ3_9RHOB|nr:ABC transporter substrate-binding protein [Sulfitobacter albidus]QUJ76760.1 ABC transporter substrate-binding protein [Sulfitobacter albidus]